MSAMGEAHRKETKMNSPEWGAIKMYLFYNTNTTIVKKQIPIDKSIVPIHTGSLSFGEREENSKLHTIHKTTYQP